MVLLVVGAMLASGATTAEPARVVGWDLSRHPIVSVYVSVDEPGALPDMAVQVREAGQGRAHTASPVPPERLRIAVVVDSSEAVPTEVFEELRAAALDLVLRLPAEVDVAVVAAGGAPAVADPTDDPAVLAATVGELRQHGEPVLLDAVEASFEQLPTGVGPGAVVVLGAAGAQPAERAASPLIRRAASGAATLHVLGRDAGPADPDALGELAAASHGELLTLGSGDELLSAAAEVSQRLGNVHRVTFMARGSGPTPVEVEVAANGVAQRAAITLPLPGAEGRDAARSSIDGPAAGRPPAGDGPAEELGRGDSRHDAARSGPDAGQPPADSDPPLAGLDPPEAHPEGGGRPDPAPTPRSVDGWSLLQGAFTVLAMALAGTVLALAGAAVTTTRGDRSAPEQRGRDPHGRGDMDDTELVTALRALPVPSEEEDVLPMRVADEAGVRWASRVGATVARRGRAVGSFTVGLTHRSRAGGGPTWRQLAEAVHEETGGELDALLAAAERIQVHQSRSARRIRRAGRLRRVLARALIALPAVPALIQADGELGGMVTVVAGHSPWVLAGAGVLTLVGGAWLWRSTAPPVSPLPPRWRRHRRELARQRQLEEGLSLGQLYAVSGLDLEAAVDRATDSDADHPASELPRLATHRRDRNSYARERTAAAWLTTGLYWWETNASAIDALRTAAGRARLEHEWAAWRAAQRLPLAVLPPTLLCLLPAMGLLAGGL